MLLQHLVNIVTLYIVPSLCTMYHVTCLLTYHTSLAVLLILLAEFPSQQGRLSVLHVDLHRPEFSTLSVVSAFSVVPQGHTPAPSLETEDETEDVSSELSVGSSSKLAEMVATFPYTTKEATARLETISI